MSKYICSLFFLILANGVFAQTPDSIFYLNQDRYVIKYITEDNPLGADDIIIAKLYRADKYLLSHIIHQSFEDSHFKETEQGNIIISPIGNTIIFYTYWSFKGEDNATKWGVRKQIYEAYQQKLLPFRSTIYLEEGLLTDGKMFLHETPSNEEEKEIFRSYIKKIQQKYKATFLFGKNADQLILETKRILDVV